MTTLADLLAEQQEQRNRDRVEQLRRDLIDAGIMQRRCVECGCLLERKDWTKCPECGKETK